MVLGKWTAKVAAFLLSITSWVVFLFLDFLDLVLCSFYKLVDEFREGKASPSCYCLKMEEQETSIHGDGVDRESELSETLHGRLNFVRALMGSLGNSSVRRGWRNGYGGDFSTASSNRWSDCGCDSCVEWTQNPKDLRLHVVVKEPERASLQNCKEKQVENVIFLHGFLASSSFWTETVFPNLSESMKQNYRLFAVDLLGFGRSPKPSDSLYTLRDHIEMIEKSVISPNQLDSFHLVAHSMGCVIALALAAEHIKSIKSVCLIAPPYLSSNEGASLMALQRLAARKIWPPLLFGSAIMSWYEHLGRSVCYIICRNHKTWEAILKFITRRRELHFMVIDFTRHTHHSAWHSMHNVICGGAKLMGEYLGILREGRVKMKVIQGARDQVVPVECSINIKMKVREAEVKIIDNADHTSVVFGREKDFVRDLESIWSAVAVADLQ